MTLVAPLFCVHQLGIDRQIEADKINSVSKNSQQIKYSIASIMVCHVYIWRVPPTNQKNKCIYVCVCVFWQGNDATEDLRGLLK